MKKIVFLLFAVLAVGGASACVKRIPAVSDTTEFTIIVTDSTQALLHGVQVKIGKNTWKTSYDGRVVLKPGQWREDDKVKLSREQYKDLSLKLSAAQTLALVVMEREPLRPGKDDDVPLYGAYEKGTPDSRMYPKLSVARAGEDGMAAVEDVYEPEIGYKVPGGGENNVKAGLLTAGEVNDFAKWALWLKVLDGSHAQFVKTWGIEPRQRYTVQVVNKDGYPVVNYPMNLTDSNGNTLFQTVTDNTGKAELWNGLTVKGDGLREPEKTIIVDEPCEAPEGVDVVFVFDATGSMGDELRYLQAEMKDVIARAKDATGGLAIRTGAVVYRDHGDEYITRLSRLTEDIAATQAFIDRQEASGGGDYPEAVPEALMAALNSAGWDENARARIAFLILDAPCHSDSATLALLHDQILNAAATGVRIVPVVCSGIRESAEYLMRSIALATNGTSFFLTDDSGIGHQHLQPTTDSLQVEHLNDMLVRTIVEFSTMPECNDEEFTDTGEGVNEQFIPNPFEAKDIAADPTIPHGEGVHYIVDVTGKLISIFEGEIENIQSSINSMPLPVGVYFVKTYIDGIWYTKKVLKR